MNTYTYQFTIIVDAFLIMPEHFKTERILFLQVPNEFDAETVQRQLRYTGMLETVRIRQAGYNVRLTYDEFIQLYRILLPKGLVR